MQKKKAAFLMLPIAVVATGCSNVTLSENDTMTDQYIKFTDDDFYTPWQSKSFTQINLNGTSIKADGTSVAALVIEDQTVTIKGAGTYVIEGTLSDGQIIVDTEESGTVRLVLNGADISSTTSAPIIVKQSGKTVISLEEGTTNQLTDGIKRKDNDQATAALYSQDDLTINGDGTLNIQANAADGIAAKDDLFITGGQIEITAADDGILGRDLFAMQNALITIDAQGDGIKSTNDEKEDKGNIVLQSGSLTINAAHDGIASVNELVVFDGTYNITAGGGSPVKIASESNFKTPGQQQTESESEESNSTTSTKGLKAAKAIIVYGGTFNIDSLDDALHSGGDITISGGAITANTGDDGIHTKDTLTITDGKTIISKSYEGLEGQNININGGHTEVTAADDGVNISGSSTNNELKQMSPTANSKQESVLSIRGGYLLVNAEGDGLDSNGDIKMTGGTAIVYGPTISRNGALDYDGTFDLKGGTLIAAGNSSMALGVSDSSTQNTVMMTFEKMLEANTTVSVTNETGDLLIAVQPAKSFQSIVISSPELAVDGQLAIGYGGTLKGTVENGVTTDATVKNITAKTVFTFDSTLVYLNKDGVTSAPSGFGGMGGGPAGGQNNNGGQPNTRSESNPNDTTQ